MWCVKGIICVLCLVMMTLCEGKLNLFLNQREVRKLLGLSAELYYVREGVINEYALNFVVPVPAHIGELHFSWQSLADVPLPYSLDVNVSNPAILPSPLLNISRSGAVPTRPQTFRLSLPCSGLASAEVDVTFTVNVTLSKAAREPTALVFRRKKICLKEDENPIWNSAVSGPDVETSHPAEVDPNSNHNAAIPSSESANVQNPNAHVFYIAIGCVCGLIAALVAVASAVCFRRRNKRRRQQGIIGVNGLGESRQGTAFLQRVETPDFHPPNSNASSKSHSSCASFRRTPIYAVPIMTTNTQKMLEHPVNGYSVSTLDSRVTLQSRDVKDKINQLAVDRSKVKLRGISMEGTFGRLLHGVYIDIAGIEQEVYVKTVTDQASSLQISMMFQEGLTFHALNHRNIQSVMALCKPELGSPMLIYPHDGFANLKRFLQRYKNSSSISLTTQSVVDMSLQLLLALQYLHRRKLIHKDIGTRNCIVDEQLRVKLCDTALSRDLFPGDYHCLGDYENRPIKWMAVESILQKEYTFASDVWMFGVLLWELTTLGQQPYLEVDPFEMAPYLRDGYRLAQPLNCPDELFAVMAYCWAMSPDDRPSLAQLHSYLQDFYSHLNRFV